LDHLNLKVGEYRDNKLMKDDIVFCNYFRCLRQWVSTELRQWSWTRSCDIQRQQKDCSWSRQNCHSPDWTWPSTAEDQEEEERCGL